MTNAPRRRVLSSRLSDTRPLRGRRGKTSLPFNKREKELGKGIFPIHIIRLGEQKPRINYHLTHSVFLPHCVTLIVFPPFVSPLLYNNAIDSLLNQRQWAEWPLVPAVKSPPSRPHLVRRGWRDSAKQEIVTSWKSPSGCMTQLKKRGREREKETTQESAEWCCKRGRLAVRRGRWRRGKRKKRRDANYRALSKRSKQQQRRRTWTWSISGSWGAFCRGGKRWLYWLTEPCAARASK